MKNQHGLSRDIPDPVKRTIRQRCGFGCVICAGAIFEYEHFDPEFSQARSHDANGITLLCPNCHAKRTRKLLSVEKVKVANASPAAIGKRYAYSELEGSSKRPFLKLAGMTLRNCETPLLIRGVPLIKIEDAEIDSGPYRLSATFFDSQQRESLLIRQNEWRVLTESWDVEVVGPSVTVRRERGEIALRLQFVAGEGLVVDRLEMLCAGFRISCNKDELAIVDPRGNKGVLTRCFADNCSEGMSLG